MKLKEQIKKGKVGMPCNYKGRTYIVMGGYDPVSKMVTVQNGDRDIKRVKISDLYA